MSIQWKKVIGNLLFTETNFTFPACFSQKSFLITWSLLFIGSAPHWNVYRLRQVFLFLQHHQEWYEDKSDSAQFFQMIPFQIKASPSVTNVLTSAKEAPVCSSSCPTFSKLNSTFLASLFTELASLYNSFVFQLTHTTSSVGLAENEWQNQIRYL